MFAFTYFILGDRDALVDNVANLVKETVESGLSLRLNLLEGSTVLFSGSLFFELLVCVLLALHLLSDALLDLRLGLGVQIKSVTGCNRKQRVRLRNRNLSLKQCLSSSSGRSHRTDTAR